MSVDQIVITAGYRYGGASWLMDIDRFTRGYDVLSNESLERGTRISTAAATASANDANVHASVNISVPQDSPEFAQALAAAKNLAIALTKIEGALNDAPSSQPIHWGNRTITAAEVINEIHNTKFIISDQSAFGNGGVSTARYGVGADPNINTLYFEAFDGDNDPLPNGSTSDYAAPVFPNGTGMIAIALHEIGHMTDRGNDISQSGYANYRREHGSYAGYEYSDYWRNNEAFANDFATQVGNAMNMDLHLGIAANTYGTTWVEPGQIYADHTGQAKPINPDLMSYHSGGLVARMPDDAYLY